MQAVRLVKFGLVGCTGMVIDFALTWLCKERLKWNKYLANSIGFCVAVINNYWLNKYYTFQNTSTQVSSQFFKFFLVASIGLLLSNSMLYLLQKKTTLNFYISKLLVIALVFLWNYSANAFFTFGK